MLAHAELYLSQTQIILFQPTPVPENQEDQYRYVLGLYSRLRENYALCGTRTSKTTSHEGKHMSSYEYRLM